MGYESGSQNVGYLWRVHVDETEELAEEAGKKFVQGPSNPFMEGNEGALNPALAVLPGLTSRKRVLPTKAVATAVRGGRVTGTFSLPYEEQLKNYSIISGTPKTVIPRCPACYGRVEAWQHLLLGRGRSHEPRRPDAQPASHGPGGHTGRERDWQGARAQQSVRR